MNKIFWNERKKKDGEASWMESIPDFDGIIIRQQVGVLWVPCQYASSLNVMTDELGCTRTSYVKYH
jgi:hypothetical protein